MAARVLACGASEACQRHCRAVVDGERAAHPVGDRYAADRATERGDDARERRIAAAIHLARSANVRGQRYGVDGQRRAGGKSRNAVVVRCATCERVERPCRNRIAVHVLAGLAGEARERRRQGGGGAVVDRDAGAVPGQHRAVHCAREAHRDAGERRIVAAVVLGLVGDARRQRLRRDRQRRGAGEGGRVVVACRYPGERAEGGRGDAARAHVLARGSREARQSGGDLDAIIDRHAAVPG